MKVVMQTNEWTAKKLKEVRRAQIPRGWSKSTLGAVLRFNYGKGLPEDSRQAGQFPVYGSNGPVGFHDEPLVNGPCIVIGRKGTVGAVHLERGPCWPIDTTYFINDFTALDPRFVSYQLDHLRLGRFDKSTAIPGISRNDVYTKDFLLCPLAEQERVADALDELLSDLDAGVAALQRVRDKLKLYRASVLKAAVEGALTAEWRAQHPDTEPASELLKRILTERRHRWEDDQVAKFKAKDQEPPKNWKARYKEPVGPNTNDLPLLPDAWEWSSLGKCFQVEVGATPSRAEKKYWGGTIPWVASGEVQFCRIHETREKITEEGLNNSSTRLNPAGSVILNMIGEGKTRGKAGVLEIAACNNQNCAAIWVSSTPMQPAWIYLWLLYRYEQTRELGSGNNQPAMNKTIVEDIVFPLPPLAEQDVIVEVLEDQLSVVDHVETELIAKLTTARGLRQAILRHAFTGQLVPQDPSDEPASELLKRIATEREARERQTASMKKPRKTKAKSN